MMGKDSCGGSGLRGVSEADLGAGARKCCTLREVNRGGYEEVATGAMHIALLSSWMHLDSFTSVNCVVTCAVSRIFQLHNFVVKVWKMR